MEEGNSGALQIRKAKTHKGRKILSAREAKMEEGVRKTLFIKSTKTSEYVSKLGHELYLLKKENSIMLGNRFDIRTFEKSSELEFLCKKHDTALFTIMSNSKKRPNNITFGRIFENQILDMAEFEVKDFHSQTEFRNINIPLNARPCIMFQGDLFEFDSNFMRIKNMFLDYFSENVELKKFDIMKFTHLVSFSLLGENEIKLSIYSVKINNLAENASEKFQLEEMGPGCILKLRRHQFANDDLYKLACKQPKLDKNKNKNVKADKIGDKRGRLFVEKQNLDVIALKKRKKLKTEKSKDKKPKKNEANEGEGEGEMEDYE